MWFYFIFLGEKKKRVRNALSWEAREGGSLPPAVMSLPPPHRSPGLCFPIFNGNEPNAQHRYQDEREKR